MQTGGILSVIAAACLVFAEASFAQGADEKPAKPDDGLKIGRSAPDFELRSCAGKEYKLSDYEDKTVVVEWINQDCPFSVGACPKMKEMAEKYAKQGVVWLAIDSTHYQTAEKNAKYAKEKELPYPILMDSDGKVGRRYGAKTTPHMFIINKGKLAYMGAHDNRKPGGPRQQPEDRSYVEEALDAVLAGKEVPSPVTEPYGCTVKYKKKEK
jgi:peroxiredoxin